METHLQPKTDENAANGTPVHNATTNPNIHETNNEEKVPVDDESSSNPTSTEEDKELFKSIINNPDDAVLLDKLNASFIQSMTFKNKEVRRSKKKNQSKMSRNGRRRHALVDISNQAAVTQKAAV